MEDTMQHSPKDFNEESVGMNSAERKGDER